MVTQIDNQSVEDGTPGRRKRPPKFSPLLMAGWEVVPLAREDGKKPLVSGYHGKNHKVADKATVKAWADTWPDCNPGIVMPPGVIGFDVDNHGADGLVALAKFEAEHGRLPVGPRIFHGYVDDGAPSPYGTRLFRIPEAVLDRFGPKMVVGNLNKIAGPGVDVIAPWLRYNVAPGAVHKSGEVYEWAIGDETATVVPTPGDVPTLTVRQAEALLTRRAQTTKPLVAAQTPLTTEERGKFLLAQTRELALLGEGETLLIEGQERGWQVGDGFFTLACALLRACRQAGKDPEKVKAQFVAEAVADGAGLDEADAERQWDNAVLAVEEDDEEAEQQPYPMSPYGSPYEFAREMLNREFRLDGLLTLRFRRDELAWCRWDAERGHYAEPTKEEVEALVEAVLRVARVQGKDGVERVHPEPAMVARLLSCLRTVALTSPVASGVLLPTVGGVPFRNGWLNVETGVLEPSTPARDVRWNVPADYDPDACDGDAIWEAFTSTDEHGYDPEDRDASNAAWRAFLDRREVRAKFVGAPFEWLKFLATLGWLPDTEEYRLLRQWYGYLLSGSKDLEKGALLIGPKRAGKGTVLRVASALMGDGAVGTTLAAMTERFGLQSMIGKGLCTIGDARFGRSDKSLNERLLSLTSNDELPVDVKNGEPLSLNLPVRLMMGTNEPPHFIEASDALATRFIIFQFTESFYGREDHGLMRRLRVELPGIARWSLTGHADLLATGSFSETAAGLRVQEQIILDSAPVRRFVEERCLLGMEHRVKNDDLFEAYKEWADRNNVFKVSSNVFFRDLRTAYPNKVHAIKMGPRTQRVNGSRGIRLA